MLVVAVRGREGVEVDCGVVPCRDAGHGGGLGRGGGGRAAFFLPLLFSLVLLLLLLRLEQGEVVQLLLLVLVERGWGGRGGGGPGEGLHPVAVLPVDGQHCWVTWLHRENAAGESIFSQSHQSTKG